MRLLQRRFLNPVPITESVVEQPVLFRLSESTLSHDQVRDALVAALRATLPASVGSDVMCCWPREIYDDYVIYEQDGPQGAAYYRRSYTIDGDGNVTLGDAQRVRVETNYVPVSESVGDGAILEALDTEGWNWRVQLIRAGTSQNNNTYDLNVLHEAAPAYAGAPVFAGRGQDHNPAERGFEAVAGYIVEATPNNDGLEGRFEINRGRPEVRESVRHAFDVRARTGRDVMGFSHVIPRDGAEVEQKRPRGFRVKKISKVSSVDIVMTPASGGSLLEPLSESSQEAIVNLTELLARYRRGERLNQEEYRFLQESMQPAEFTALLAEAVPLTAAHLTDVENRLQSAPLVQPNTVVLDEATANRLHELEQRSLLAESRSLLTTRLAESRLPEAMRTAIATDFDARIFEASELDARITRDREIAAQLAAVRPHGLGLVQPGADQRDNWSAAMDAFFGIPNDRGIPAFRSLKEAFQAITGDGRSYIDPQLARDILREAAGYLDPQLRESVTSTTFDQLWGDSITRRLLQEYQAPMYNSWRLIVSDIVPINDFRTQRRMRMGGYGSLPAVGQGGTYQNLTSPGDEESTYAVSKYGGLEDLTLEAIANDDVGAVRLIPRKLGRAAARTLYLAVWVTTIVNNVVMTYDSVALYHSSHANTNTLALSAANLLTSENAMRNQTAYGESGLVLGMANMPKFLVIPNGLRDTAFRLTQSGVAVGAGTYSAEPNIFAGSGYVIIVVDEFTDSNDWFLFADPNNIPTFEVGFLGGREDPELFVQDQPNVGSNFTADKVTYKIRHIWGIGPFDHRSTYRNVVAGG